MGHLRDIQGGRKVVSVTMQTPQETLLGTPETLPTSEPATPQISYTVASGDLPTFSPALDGKKWTSFMIAGGKFVTAGTLYHRMKKNGSSVNQSSGAVAANSYYTRACFFYDIAVGDVLEIALWSNKSDSNYDYKAYQIQPTRIVPKLTAPFLMPCNITSIAGYPTLSQGNPYAAGTNGYYPCHEAITGLAISSTLDFEVLRPEAAQFGIYRLYYGDVNYLNGAVLWVHTTYRPWYYKIYVPTGLVFRPVKV